MGLGMNKKKAAFYNILFLMAAAGILVFLLMAPPESTVKLPRDKDHIMFYDMSRKEAETHCSRCHGKDAGNPLPEKHPPKFRCLFCHKLTRAS